MRFATPRWSPASRLVVRNADDGMDREAPTWQFSAGRPLPDEPQLGPRLVNVPWVRVEGWIERYDARHPETRWAVAPEIVTARSADGTTAELPVPVTPLGDITLQGFLAHLHRPWQLGIVLVRRGGFAVAALVGDEVVESKVGQRHVQGRTKAGGWSQQRFARRRDNQARAAFDAAAGYVQQLLLPRAARLDLLGTGGDRAAVDTVFEARGLEPLAAIPRQWLGAMPDPRRRVLDAAVAQLRSLSIEIHDPP